MKPRRPRASSKSYAVPDDQRRAHRPLLLALLFSVTAGCVVNPPSPVQSGQGGGQNSAAMPPPDTVTREFHPSGPTVVRTWRGSADAPPDRIELTHARSGRRLIGQARLLRQPGGPWFIETSTGDTLPLSGDAPSSTVTFEESAQRWRIRVLKQEEPVVTPGIATEGEPNLDLVLERQP
jgi:hypothetical protein